MKRSIMLIAGALLVASAVQAELKMGPIEDYMPLITVNALGMGEGNQYRHQYQLGEFDLIEGTQSKYRLKEECREQSQTNGCGIVTLQNLEFDPDPTVFANQLIYNNTGSTQTYFIDISQPAYLAAASSEIHGYIGIALNDYDHAGGATLSDNSRPIYKAYIDGVEAGTLFDDPYTLSTAGNLQTNINASFGWDPFGAGVASNITISVQFMLSAGDTATVQSRFDVVPEPASLVLIGITTSSLIFVKRRFMA